MNTHTFPISRQSVTGVGLGLRWSFLEDALALSPGETPISFFEVSPENYMRRGGFFPTALERIAEGFPLSTHGLTLSLGGLDPLDTAYLNELKHFVSRFGGAYHSDHACFGSLGGVQFHDLLPVPMTRDYAAHIGDRVRRAQDHIRKPMLIENVSYYMELGDSDAPEPEFLTRILEHADCRLLLDLNNLDVNAKNHGFDPWGWLAKIPLDRVGEIHVAGPEHHPCGLLVDTHGTEVGPDVYAMLEWVIERTGPLPVLLERDSNVPTLAVLIEEVRRLDGVYKRALSRRAPEVHHAA